LIRKKDGEARKFFSVFICGICGLRFSTGHCLSEVESLNYSHLFFNRPKQRVGVKSGYRLLSPQFQAHQHVKIYTKTGDKGDTSLFGGQRVPKDAMRIEAYGTVDELNSILGLVRADNVNADIDAVLAQIQNALFKLGADLATPRSVASKHIKRMTLKDALPLEKIIDTFEGHLKPLKFFILPGGSRIAARLHFARTVCRRAERVVVRLSRNEDIGDAIVVFLNRLSDLLFILARYANHVANVSETTWKS
jgi:cob(I)alamin adenosyltransferase